MPTINPRVTINPPQPVYDIIDQTAAIRDTKLGTAALDMIREHLDLMKAELRRVPLTLPEIRAALKMLDENTPGEPLVAPYAHTTSGRDVFSDAQHSLIDHLLMLGPSFDYALRQALHQLRYLKLTPTADNLRSVGISVKTR